MKTRILFLPVYTTLIFIFICCVKKDLTFQSIDSLNYTYKGNNGIKNFTNRGVFFLIDQYEESSENERIIESFVNSNKSADYKEYNSYSIIFYKKSSRTTIENINSDSKLIDRYSNDLVFTYTWTNGQFMTRFKYKNGEIVEPKSAEVILSPAPPLQDSIR